MSHKVLVFLIILNSVFARSQKCIDTIETSIGKILVFSNQTWRIYDENKFDGVMNKRIHGFMTKDQVFSYNLNWNNNACHSGVRNDLGQMKDSVWLYLNEGESSQYYPPVPGIVTSTYKYRNGRYHTGMDLDLETGDTVYASWSGKVRYAKYNEGGYGNLVIIRHPNSLETYYAHLSKFLVYPNQDVKAGDPIALGGNTGHSFGSHLHYEVRFYDATLNPEEIIDFRLKKLKKDSVLVHKGLFRAGAKPSDYYYSANKTEEVKEIKEDENSKEESVVVKPKPVVRTSQAKYYQVRSGDTLSSIARKHNTTVSKLCQLNRIKTNSVLRVGKSLRVK
ncbi:MAG: LysM peptidoglycan-binding domain-containing protein [Bacteroidetes bacterium]|nr:LysM peptidoglycan-binding domain-containing protein [Bacteroidota bacterium]